MSIDVSRRRFLAGSAAVCTAGAVTPLVAPQLAFAASGPAAHTLVLVLLDGGLDGLSALIPAGDRSYGHTRSSTRVREARTLGVDSTFALHPALSPLFDLWTGGLMAAIPAVGTVTRSRSHVLERAVIARGAGGRGGDATGWLARHLVTRAGGAPAVLQGMSSGDQPAPELVGHSGAFHMPDLTEVGIGGWNPAELPAAERALAARYATAPRELAGSAGTAFDALHRLRSSGAATMESRAVYGPDPWSQHLRQVGQVVRADVGLEAAVVNFGGWDTHYAQGGAKGRLADQLDRLARALATFTADLQDNINQLTVVVLSEFGRRVAENRSGGTDHGQGGVAFVVGGGLRGGVHGEWPGLDATSLDRGDVAVATDVRSVLAEVVRGRLGSSALDRVFPNFTPVPVGFT